MGTILCATRGGEASIRTQEHAIALAKARETDIVFIWVADVQFLNHAGGNILVDVMTEMEHMGEFLLLMAQERAQKAGVEASTVVKRGLFRQALIDTAREVEAGMLVLGTPGDESLTARQMLEEVIAAVKAEVEVESVIVDID